MDKFKCYGCCIHLKDGKWWCPTHHCFSDAATGCNENKPNFVCKECGAKVFGLLSCPCWVKLKLGEKWPTVDQEKECGSFEKAFETLNGRKIENKPT